MSFDVHDGSGHGRTTGGNKTPDVVVPRIEPEEEPAVSFPEPSRGPTEHAPGSPGPAARTARASSPPGPAALNQSALGAIIDRQARFLGIDGLLEVRPTPTRLSLTVDDLRKLGNCEDDDESSRRTDIKARVESVSDQRPFLPLQTSVNVYTQLRDCFNGIDVDAQVDLSKNNWPVISSDRSGIEVATADVARYYGLRRTPPAGCPAAQLVPQNRDELRQALDNLRSDTGGKIVALYSDWRMWMAWLAAGNPILCLGALSESLRRGKERLTAPDVEKPCLKHVFIIAGYQVLDHENIQAVSRAIGAGQRVRTAVPVEFIVRNSWDASWGKDGHLRIPYAHFFNQFREAHGLLLKDPAPPSRW